MRASGSDTKARAETPGSRLFLLGLLLLAVVAAMVFLLSLYGKAGEGEEGSGPAPFVMEEGRSEASLSLSAEGREASAVPRTDSPAEAKLFGWNKDAGLDGDEDGTFLCAPPVPLPPSLRPHGYTRGTNIETWKARGEASCKDVAKELLLELQRSGMKLVEAGYLDLYGEAWGCTLDERGEASLVIMLIPEKPLALRSETNQLCVTVIRTSLPPQLAMLAADGAPAAPAVPAAPVAGGLSTAPSAPVVVSSAEGRG
ncbi:MAG: hypothetical protein LBH56_02590 [Coriobacteriales bacterium]|jgi:hypothetical protein|nr:hypothetical protein [Coriobacteriales bacterium]